MEQLTLEEMYAIEGGASKYVTCPICSYERKSSWFERIFSSNGTLQYRMSSMHCLYGAWGGFDGSQDVHKK